MTRKNLLTSVSNPATVPPAHDSRVDYALRGASRSMKQSIEELADTAKRVAAGETIVDLSADLIDPSAIKDRIDDDDELDFAALLESIKAEGQHQPILVRPNPKVVGRFLIVFGRRRLRAATELGRPCRAIIKTMDETAHVIAQGQENTRRKDYSFIEKALFAQHLIQLGHPKDVAKAALTIDDSLLSRMLSITEIIPPEIISQLGAARTIGRDRWENLKRLFTLPNAADRAAEIMESEEFIAGDSAGRFNFLAAQLKKRRRNPHNPRASAAPEAWSATDNRVAATYRQTGKKFNLSLTAPEAGEFGRFISAHLDDLYQAFKGAKIANPTGDSPTNNTPPT